MLTGWRCSGSGLDAKVVAGVVDLNDWRGRQERRVVRVVVKGDFDAGTLFNDMALWELDEPLSMLAPVDLVSDPYAQEVP